MATSGLGGMLVEERLLSERDRRTIKEMCGRASASFAKAVVALGMLDEDELATFLAQRTRVRIAAKDLLSEMDSDVIGIVDPPLIAKLEVLPLRRDGHILHVAMVDPTDRDTLRQLEFFTGMKIRPVIATLGQIRQALTNVAPGYSSAPSPVEEFLSNHLEAALRQLHLKDRSTLRGKKTKKPAPPAETELPGFSDPEELAPPRSAAPAASTAIEGLEGLEDLDSEELSSDPVGDMIEDKAAPADSPSNDSAEPDLGADTSLDLPGDGLEDTSTPAESSTPAASADELAGFGLDAASLDDGAAPEAEAVPAAAEPAATDDVLAGFGLDAASLGEEPAAGSETMTAASDGDIADVALENEAAAASQLESVPTDPPVDDLADLTGDAEPALDGLTADPIESATEEPFESAVDVIDELAPTPDANDEIDPLAALAASADAADNAELDAVSLETDIAPAALDEMPMLEPEPAAPAPPPAAKPVMRAPAAKGKTATENITATLNRAMLGLAMAADRAKAMDEAAKALSKAGIEQGIFIRTIGAKVDPLAEWKTDDTGQARLTRDRLVNYVTPGMGACLEKMPEKTWADARRALDQPSQKPFADWETAGKLVGTRIPAKDGKSAFVVVAAWKGHDDCEPATCELVIELLRRVARFP